MVKVWFLLTCLSLIPQSVGNRWVQVESMLVFGENESRESVRYRTLREARRRAIEQANGIDVSGETIVMNGALAADFVRGRVQGSVIKEEILQNAPEFRNGELYWKVLLRAFVTPPRQVSTVLRPTVLLNKDNFAVSDPIILTVSATSDCYIYIFNVDPNDAVTLLFPTKFHSTNFMGPGPAQRIPSIEEEKIRRLVAELPRGVDVSEETILTVATREKIELWPEIKEADRLHDTKTTALLDTLWQSLFTLQDVDWGMSLTRYRITRSR